MCVQIEQLAKAALPTSEEDWGSERQVHAETEFYTQVEKIVTPAVYERFSDWALKATAEESVAEALRLSMEAGLRKEEVSGHEG